MLDTNFCHETRLYVQFNNSLANILVTVTNPSRDVTDAYKAYELALAYFPVVGLH